MSARRSAAVFLVDGRVLHNAKSCSIGAVLCAEAGYVLLQCLRFPKGSAANAYWSRHTTFLDPSPKRGMADPVERGGLSSREEIVELFGHVMVPRYVHREPRVTELIGGLD